MSDILADDVGEGLAAEFEAAANDPDGFDFAFKAEREATGFANFGFDPAKAAELRAADPSNRPIEQEEDFMRVREDILNGNWSDPDEDDWDDDEDDTDWEDEEDSELDW